MTTTWGWWGVKISEKSANAIYGKPPKFYYFFMFQQLVTMTTTVAANHVRVVPPSAKPEALHGNLLRPVMQVGISSPI